MSFSGRIVVTGPISTDGLRAHLSEPAARLPAGRGGAAVTRLVRGLLVAGHEVTVVTADGGVEPSGGEVVAEGPRLRIRYVPFRPRHRARDAFAAERAAVQRAVDAEPDGLVHAHWTYEYALGALRTGRPTLVTVRDWGPTILRLHPGPYRAVRLLMQIRTLQVASHFTTNSPYLEAKLRRWIKDPVAVIPNPIDADQFGPPHRGPRPRAPVILAVNAGWSRRKNVARLLTAFQQLRRSLPDAELRLVGPGYGAGEEAERWARREAETGGVRFLGPLPMSSVLEAMRASDLFVHPSLEESFGNVLVEAMAQGVPVIGGKDSGAVPWVLGHGDAGLLVDVRAADELAAAMLTVCRDRDVWDRLSRAGRENAAERFRTDTVVAAYERCYDDVRSGAGPDGRTP